ncbi:DUF393 domain-containing protein, partial [Verrucomicrobia bacterium]|nr:DUF393 domain-containing protein [Verrucomicrobiota bacterium]
MKPTFKTIHDQLDTTISVKTETTELIAINTNDYRVFYDGECNLCKGLLRRFGGIFKKRAHFEPLQETIKHNEFNLPTEEFLREMKLLRPDGTWAGGADAWIALFKTVWYLYPIGVIAALPGIHAMVHAIYRRIARKRHCSDGNCGIEARPATGEGRAPFPALVTLTIAIAPLFVFPTLTFAIKDLLIPWMFMWILAFAT